MITLMVTRWAPDLVLGAGLTVLLVVGVVSPEQALSGLSNSGLVAIALLYMVAAALVETGVAHRLGGWLLGQHRSVHLTSARFLSGVTTMSAFMNNTPIVAMMMPALEKWCEQRNIAASKVMMPLSFAAILGGTCSLIGTSTNLLIDGMIRQQTDITPLGFFEISWVGLPVAIVSIGLMLLLGPRLLPERKSAISMMSGQRYTMELQVPEGCPIIGKNIEEAGLRQLKYAFLAELRRGENMMPAVSPSEVIECGDQLIFVGQSQAVDDLTRNLGLITPEPVLETEDVVGEVNPTQESGPHKVTTQTAQRRPQTLRVEVVVSPLSALIGTPLKNSRFRQKTGAVVLAAARGGSRIEGPLGELILQAGDLLLLDTRPAFVQQQHDKDDFIVIKSEQIQNQNSPVKARIACAVFVLLIVALAAGWIDLLKGALLASGTLLAANCISSSQARRSIDLSVIFSVAAALGISAAVHASGLATNMGQFASGLWQQSPMVLLTGVYLTTLITTLLMTNNAAAVLIFPLALSASQDMGIDFRPIAMTIIMAASASFATPIGYQTNLMVMGPGGYRFMDYLRLGGPLTVVHAFVSIVLIPLIWPF